MAATTKEKMVEGIESWKKITGVLVSIPALKICALGILVLVYS